MAVGTFSKLSLLVWKNYVLQKRHCVQTLLQISIPLIFMLFLLYVRNKVQSSGPSYNKKNPPINPAVLNFSPDIRKVYYTPNASETAEIMEKILYTKFLSSNFSIGEPKFQVEGFESENVLLQQYDREGGSYRDRDTAVVVFDKVAKGKFEYTLRLLLDVSDVKTNELYEKAFFRDSTNTFDNQGRTRYNSDFLALQYAIDVSLIHYTDQTIPIGADDKTNMIGGYEIFLQDFPSSPIYTDYFPGFIKEYFPFIFVMSFLYPVITTAKSITVEKEQGLKEFLKLVGIPNMIHWGGWFIKQFFPYFLSAVVITVLFKWKISDGTHAILTYSDASVALCFLLSYLWSAVFSAFFISAMFSKGTASALAAGLYWYLSSFPYGNYIEDHYHELSLSARLAFSLLPNVAMSIGWRIFAVHEFRQEGVHWATIATPLRSRDGYTMLHCIFMLLLDGILCFICALYIEIVFPGKFGIPLPWYFPFQKSFWNVKRSPRKLVEEIAIAASIGSLIEPPPLSNDPAIVLQGLTKAFGKKVAVRNLSFTIYKNHITALLGHNGAGKTTTMAMLTGLFPPSAGTANINGYDIRTHMKQIRESLGLCPQHNTLFDELTVEEHLWFFCKLRDCPKVNDEINRMIGAVGLQAKRNVQSKKLSGGMKRKLCVAIALVGGPKFILLDEPTSGMDPGARRSTWDLLATERQGRTIVLSTHFMDEADLLSDRIAIMADGELQTIGSSLFLKKKFGAGYNLTVVKNEGCEPAQVTQLLRNHLGEDIVLGQDVGTELSYSLPDEMSGNFADMFEELEQQQEELHVSSYGASSTTMEQVFLRVNEEAIERKNLSNSGKTATKTPGHTVEIYSPLQFNRDLGSRVLQQFMACFLKRILCAIRNIPLLTSQFLIAPVLLLLVLILLKTSHEYSMSPNFSLRLDLSVYGSTVTPISCNLRDKICKESLSFAKSSGTKVYNLPENINLTQWLAQREQKIGDDFNFEYIMTLSQSGQQVTAFFNAQPLHSRPIAVNYLSNILLRSLTGGTGNIVTRNHPLEMPKGTSGRTTSGRSSSGSSPSERSSSGKSSSGRSFSAGRHYEMNTLPIALVVVIGLSFIVSPFLVHQIKERTSKAKHLQFTAGAIWSVFWLTNLLVDFGVYMIVASIQIVILVAFDVKNLASGIAGLSLFFLYCVYGCTITPLIYLTSFMFKGPATGYSILVVLNILFGFSSIMIVYFLKVFSIPNVLPNFETMRMFFSLAVPNFNLGWGMIEIAATSRNYLSWNEGIARHLFFMLVHGTLGVLMLFIIDNKIWRKIPRRVQWAGAAIAPALNQDTDVAAEANRIHMTNLKELIAVDNIIVRDLFKQFEYLWAVSGLSFGVHQKECFGLLGVNGAGKTTTFSILTGEIAPTSGDAIVYGHSVNSDIRKVQSNIGYCPQFDALLGELTGREMIELLARLRGVKEHQMNQLVNKLGASLLLEEHMNKPCGIYSGGNQRKLSTALAFVGNPPIVFMDEPTTGMDPGARRYVWNCINQVRDAGASIVLTSHSMEECEMLCTRLAIMVSGQFVCLGSIQHLKSKFSQGFTVTAQMSREIKAEGEGDDWQAELQPLRMFIEEAFPGCVLKDAHPQYVNYNVFNPELRWSQIFRKMEEAKEAFKLEAYSVSQTTLEDVFLSLTKQ